MTKPRDRRTRPGKLPEAASTKPERSRDPEPAPFSITLRDIELPPPAQTPQPPIEELVRSDPEARHAPWLGDPEAERAEQRAARRAQVRRDRLRDATPEADFLPTLSQAIGLQPSGPADQVPTLHVDPSAAVAKPQASEAPAASAVPRHSARPAAGTEPPAGDVPTLSDALPATMEVPPKSTVPAARATTHASATPLVGAAQAAGLTPPRAVNPPAADKGAGVPSILVLRATAADPDPLCDQLTAFGFDVQVRQDMPELAAPWPFVAVFIDHALRPDAGGDAIDLCNDVRERSRLPGVLKPVLVLVADQLSSTNRVRAGLAGCNEILLGAVTRGAVAKVLDSRGIALPSDARRR